MDSKYQVVLLDTRTGRFRAAAGSGSTAMRWDTLEQAQADLATWTAMFTPKDHLRLAVQRIDYSLVPGTETTCDGLATPAEAVPLAEQNLPTGGLALLFVCDGENPGQPDATRTITVTDLTAVTRGGPPICADFDCDNQDEDLRFIGYLPDDDPRLDTI